MNTIDFNKLNPVRIAHNYLMRVKEGNYQPAEINVLNNYVNEILNPSNQELPKYKVGVLIMCVNQPYWQFLPQLLTDMKTFFLPGHDVEYLIWSDMPQTEEDTYEASMKGELFPVEPIQWPMGTLMRYHTFLQQEEKLKEFDYLFYIDVDMRMVNVVGDEILNEGLMMAEHPMYALRREYVPPYEPNKESSAFVNRFGTVLQEKDKKRFKPLYAAGGFQGGKTEAYIQAMKEIRKTINEDIDHNYIAIWNDESHWNKYLSNYVGPLVVLSPSYVYPDSLIEEYYKKVWGCDYPPKIITLTKRFTTSPEHAEAIKQQLKSM